MTLTFISNIDQQGKLNKIEFKSPVTISEELGFRVYEFKDPQLDIMNRIEVSLGAINIFSGPSTLNLLLNRDLRVEYTTSAGPIYLISHLYSAKFDGQNAHFKYALKDQSATIGEYEIKLLVTPIN